MLSDIAQVTMEKSASISGRWRILLNIGFSGVLLVLVILLSDPVKLWTSIKQFPPEKVVMLGFLLIANLLMAAFRFWRILEHFSLRIPWVTAFIASMAGNLAGLLVIPLLGQVVGRQSILRKSGIPSVLNASIAGYERAVVALTSGFLALIGAFELLDHRVAYQFVKSLDLGEIIIVITIALVFNFALAHGRYEHDLARGALKSRNLMRLIEIMMLGLAGQLLMLTAFVVGFHAMAPEIDVLKLFFGSAIISFAASMPVSIGGWGVRELAAVYVMGKLGMEPSEALAVSIFIGMLSTMVILATGWGGMYLFNRKVSSVSCTKDSERIFNLERTASWVLGFSVAVAIFFQVHISLPGGLINVNLADPLALLSLAAVSLHCFSRRCFPMWRVKEFNTIIMVMTLVLCLGFFIGWSRFGITQWALGKLFGAPVLLGYLLSGYMVSAQFGSHGLRRVVETMATLAVTIIIVKILLRISAPITHMTVPANFEGYVGNRNAFGFQLLVVLSLLMGYSRLIARRAITGMVAGVVLLGILLTASRASIGVAIILLLFSYFTNLANRKMLMSAIGIAFLGWILVQIVPYLLSWIYSSGNAYMVSSPVSGAYSNQMRWIADLEAIKEWLAHPVFGAGLGAFLVDKAHLFSEPMIIHSTPLWILAEFGLLGLVAMLWIVYVFARFLVLKNAWNAMPVERTLILIVFAFTLFSQVHEMLYQRILWFVIGALLAVPFAMSREQMSSDNDGEDRVNPLKIQSDRTSTKCVA